VVLDSQQRHLRRKLISLKNGDELLVDLEKPAQLADHDCLMLDDGRLIEVIAADEDLLEVRARGARHLARLAWHIGNRHLEAQIEERRILIRPDHVIAHMLEHHGAKISHVRAPFLPEHGAYHLHSDAHGL
jgi:urease accessory protein